MPFLKGAGSIEIYAIFVLRVVKFQMVTTIEVFIFADTNFCEF